VREGNGGGEEWCDNDNNGSGNDDKENRAQ